MCRADEKRRVGGGAALPSDGCVQVGGTEARVQMRRHARGVARTDQTRDRTIPCRRMPRPLIQRSANNSRGGFQCWTLPPKSSARSQHYPRYCREVTRDLIGTQPILTAFLAIGVGYLVGQINIGGFSLGVGAVLFVGLALGALAPKAQIVGPIGLTGLIMFLYGIGILYGRQFFEGMRGVGRKYNLLALIGCLAGLAVALGLGHVFGIKLGHTLGLYAGSMTSTATLQAALDVM